MAHERRTFGVPLSVLDAISLPPLNVAEVLSGRAVLGFRSIRWIQALHWPAAEFVRPGDLVLTTGVAPSQDEARAFLDAVVDSDAAALIVSLPPATDVRAVLTPVVTRAQDRGFPLLSLPWDVPLADVTRSVVTRLLASGCPADEATCALRHSGIRVAPAEMGVAQELARAMALHHESAVVQVALGRPTGSRGSGAAFESTMTSLGRLATHRHLSLRICRRPQVALLVLEDAENSVTLRDLVEQARQMTGDTTSHWVIADQEREEHARTTEEQGAGPLQVGREILRERGSWVASQSLESLFVLGAMAQSPLITPVVADAVGPLVDYDRQHRRNLVETLEVYLDESCNTSAAARRLFLNRHSLMYRLRKIEELTGFSLKESADRFFLHASVRLYRYRLVDDMSSGDARLADEDVTR